MQSLEERREYKREYYRNNKARIYEWNRKWRRNNKEKVSAYHREYSRNNRDKINAYNREYRHKNKTRAVWYILRVKIIEKLGGRCVKCGVSDVRGLEIDHITGGGRKELRSFNGNHEKYYRHILNFIDKHPDQKIYQVLCGYHHLIKTAEEEEQIKANEEVRKQATKVKVGPVDSLDKFIPELEGRLL